MHLISAGHRAHNTNPLLADAPRTQSRLMTDAAASCPTPRRNGSHDLPGGAQLDNLFEQLGGCRVLLAEPLRVLGGRVEFAQLEERLRWDGMGWVWDWTGGTSIAAARAPARAASTPCAASWARSTPRQCATPGPRPRQPSSPRPASATPQLSTRPSDTHAPTHTCKRTHANAHTPTTA
jgi:hypothetical protein